MQYMDLNLSRNRRNLEHPLSPSAPGTPNSPQVPAPLDVSFGSVGEMEMCKHSGLGSHANAPFPVLSFLSLLSLLLLLLPSSALQLTFSTPVERGGERIAFPREDSLQNTATVSSGVSQQESREDEGIAASREVATRCV
jgi:hypothetical protein